MSKNREGYEVAVGLRNSYRGLIEKLLSKNKVPAEVIEREEADRLNELVDARTGDMSPQEAADTLVDQSSEFSWFENASESDRSLVINEYIKQTAPGIESAANSGDLKTAFKSFWVDMYAEKDRVTDGDSRFTREELDELDRDFYGTYMQGKIESLVAIDDDESLQDFIESFPLKQIPPEYTRQYMGLLKTHFSVSDNESALAMIADIEGKSHEYEAQIQESRDRAREIAAEDSEWI
jgi:hypothetical protein